MLFSSTTRPGHTSDISSSLVTNWPWRLTSNSRMSKARWPIVTGTPCASSSRRATCKRNGPNTKASFIAITPRALGRRLRLHEPQRQPVAAVAAFVVHAAGEAAHEMNPEVADLRLLEGRRHGWRRHLGRIELPAVVHDPGDQRRAVVLDFDHDLEPCVAGPAVHDDVGHGFFQAELDGERHVARNAFARPALDPRRQPFQFGEIVVQYQAAGFRARHRTTMTGLPSQRFRFDGSESRYPFRHS